MNKVITHCADTKALITELQKNYPEQLDENNVWLLLQGNKTPTVRNGKETLAYVAVSNEQLAQLQQMQSITVLGDYADVFADKVKKAIYDRVYDQTPIAYTDENGKKVTANKPEKFGVFA